MSIFICPVSNSKMSRSVIPLVIVCWMALGSAISGVHWCFGIFVEPVKQEFGCSYKAFNFAYSVGMITGGLSAPFVGRFIDRFGPARCMICAALSMTTGFSIRALSPSLSVYYGGMLFLGPAEKTMIIAGGIFSLLRLSWSEACEPTLATTR